MDVAALIARHEPESPALVCDDTTVSYGALGESMRQVASGLAERTEVGDVIVVIGETSVEFVQVVLGALLAGRPVLPLHPRYPVAELSHACALASPALIVHVGGPLDAEVRAELGGTLVDGDDLLRPAAPAASAGQPPAIDESAPALLMFTSGTAGSPRLAVLTRANLAASIGSAITSTAQLDDFAAVILGVMPLTHVLGLVSVVGVAVAAGSTLVLAAETDVDHIVDLVEQHRVTLLVAPPVFWYRMVEAAPDRERLASVQLALSGAAPLTGSLAARIGSELGLHLRQGYGLTEASPGLTSSIGTMAPATSVGRPLPGVELRLVDEFGDDALVGDVGEVWARGANIFDGYLGDADATSAVLTEDGWLHTGDLAVVDENGFLYIVGRNKDQIICAGFNVHPGEVEDWLATHPQVTAAAVVGEADREYGEIVVAYVVPAATAVASDADGFQALLQAHCRLRLAGYKVPARVELVDELPRSRTGKLRRRALRST